MGLDISETALKQANEFSDILKISAIGLHTYRSRRLKTKANLPSNANVVFKVDDFFNGNLGQFDLVYDYTCA